MDPDRSSGAVVDTQALSVMAEHGAILHHMGMRRSTTHPANPLAAARLVFLVRRIRPDVIHGHSSVGGALARIVGAVTGVPVVYTPNALATGPVVVRIERALGRATAAFVAVSESEADLALSLKLVDPERVRVVPNGIDLSYPAVEPVLDLRARLGLRHDAPLVGTVARLVEQKAPEDFVAVCAAVSRLRPDVHSVLIGMGPLQGLVDQAIAREGLQGQFHQIEYLPGAANVLDQLDVFVLCSRFEGAPYTPLEAMRAKVPVVLSDVVGNRDVIQQGVSGMLCAVGDIEGMAQAVAGLLDRGPRREAMVEAATRRLHKHFDLATMGADLTDLYKALSTGGMKS
jgi:glycosyltransferase involved in cell wall biosynthesis